MRTIADICALFNGVDQETDLKKATAGIRIDLRTQLIVYALFYRITVKETNELLGSNHCEKLYARNVHDAVIMYALDKKLGVEQCCTMDDKMTSILEQSRIEAEKDALPIEAAKKVAEQVARVNAAEKALAEAEESLKQETKALKELLKELPKNKNTWNTAQNQAWRKADAAKAGAKTKRQEAKVNLREERRRTPEEVPPWYALSAISSKNPNFSFTLKNLQDFCAYYNPEHEAAQRFTIAYTNDVETYIHDVDSQEVLEQVIKDNVKSFAASRQRTRWHFMEFMRIYLEYEHGKPNLFFNDKSTVNLLGLVELMDAFYENQMIDKEVELTQGVMTLYGKLMAMQNQANPPVGQQNISESFKKFLLEFAEKTLKNQQDLQRKQEGQHHRDDKKSREACANKLGKRFFTLLKTVIKKGKKSELIAFYQSLIQVQIENTTLTMAQEKFLEAFGGMFAFDSDEALAFADLDPFASRKKKFAEHMKEILTGETDVTRNFFLLFAIFVNEKTTRPLSVVYLNTILAACGFASLDEMPAKTLDYYAICMLDSDEPFDLLGCKTPDDILKYLQRTSKSHQPIFETSARALKKGALQHDWYVTTHPCRNCQGEGKVVCPVCHGTKADVNNPKKACAHCKGTGSIPCPVCKGTRVHTE